MNAEKWQKIKIILEETIEIAPASREPFLKKACAGNETLRREVESLLDFDEATGANALLEQDAFSAVMRNGIDEKARNFVGERILARTYFVSGKHWKNYARAAKDEKARGKSCELMQKSFDLLDGMQRQGTLSEVNAGRTDQIYKELSECQS